MDAQLEVDAFLGYLKIVLIICSYSFYSQRTFQICQLMLEWISQALLEKE